MKLKSLVTVSIASLAILSGCTFSEMNSTLSNTEASSELSSSSQTRERLSSYYRDRIDQSIDDAIADATSHQSVLSESFEYGVLNNTSELVKEIVRYYRKQLANKEYMISDIDVEYLQDHRLIVVSMVIE